MERSLIKALEKWKTSPTRKPLILWGARQVGKTWLMREFGKRYYPKTAYASFFRNTRLARLFKEDFSLSRVLENLNIECRTMITPDDTLIILDEIQDCPEALEYLKFFCEEAPQYHIICAGSMLGVTIHEGISFPVGKVNELTLYPLDFKEYLQAMGENDLLDTLISGSWELVNDNHESYVNHLRNYYYVGGMPEAVAYFADHRDYQGVRDIQNSIIRQYEEDFSKHIPPNEWTKVLLVWHSIPVQLAKENRKFFFGQVKPGARMKDLENAIMWLCKYGVACKVFKTTKPAVPLAAYADPSSFKLFLSDTGLAGALSELDAEVLLNGNAVFSEFKGALTEEYVFTQLLADRATAPFYYAGDKGRYETDFLLRLGQDIIPVEVKAETNLKSKSLKFYVDKFDPPYALRISMAPYIVQNRIRNIPLYAVCRINSCLTEE